MVHTVTEHGGEEGTHSPDIVSEREWGWGGTLARLRGLNNDGDLGRGLGSLQPACSVRAFMPVGLLIGAHLSAGVK